MKNDIFLNQYLGIDPEHLSKDDFDTFYEAYVVSARNILAGLAKCVKDYETKLELIARYQETAKKLPPATDPRPLFKQFHTEFRKPIEGAISSCLYVSVARNVSSQLSLSPDDCPMGPREVIVNNICGNIRAQGHG